MFADELRQYESNSAGVLVDRFHGSNRYFVAMDGRELLGMISFNDDPPFSIEKRLPDRSVLDGIGRPCEIRLLAVEPGARYGMVLAGLFWQVYAAATDAGCAHMLISGVRTQREMYRALGFNELGPAVASGDASYIPMVMKLADERLVAKAKKYSDWWARRGERDEVKLLPGPVQISERVREAFARRPMSHRESAAIELYEEVRERLSVLAGGMPVAVMAGSGTLANDIVGACLRARFGEGGGIVLANGEFGERLIRQARTAGLKFKALQWTWGSAWDHEEIEEELRGADWVWGVHLETSTGVLNDVPRLCTQARDAGAVVAADCVSSIGAVPLDGLELSLASGVSGKALGAYAGLTFVFSREEALEGICFESMPASFNIRNAIRQRDPVFTLPMPQLAALAEALRSRFANRESAARRFKHYAALSAWVRRELRELGHTVLAREEHAAPTICTFPLPLSVAERCRRAGFHPAYESCYLRERGWGQIGVMGELDEEVIRPVFSVLGCADRFDAN